MKIDEIDRNFLVSSQFPREDIRFHDVLDAPVEQFGMIYENGCFRRMPQQIAAGISDNIAVLNCQTAGGRVRFRTDSTFVAIAAQMSDIGKMPHFALTGSAGFDLFQTVDGEEQYVETFIPPFDLDEGYHSMIPVVGNKMRTFTIHFPLYSGVKKLWIGLQEDASLVSPEPYRDIKPMVSYGSSITQGGCASRPGNSYQAMLTRRFHVDHINLGFSGSALGEPAMADYIRSLPMSVFFLDYDHNAPTVEHLNRTHWQMYRAVRAAHPEIPIIIMSRPKYRLNPEEKDRLAVIGETYRRAQESGDSTVYFLTGAELTSLCGDGGTVDNCHPNDWGFASMAQTLGDLLERIGVFS